MKNIIFLLLTVFLFIGCVEKKTLIVPIKEAKQEKISKKTHYYIEEFIYKKDQIDFFENEYKNVLKIDNREILEKFTNFYKKNASYFKNYKPKVSELEKKLQELSLNKKENSHKSLLTKALSLNKDDAIKVYEQLAHDGNIFAQRELAQIYKYEDKIKSVFWYKKLIENNDIQSIKDFAFANLYMVNPIVVQNTKRAVELYEKLDALGEISGLVHLGNIYEYGYFKNDIPVNKNKSLQYFEKAASKGYTPAQKKLVKIYLCEKCEGDRYNKQKAIKILNTLIKKGDKKSKIILAKISSNEPIKEEELQEEERQKQEKEEFEKL